MSSRRKSRPPTRVRFELAEIAAQHIIREREQGELKRRREAQRLMSVTSFHDAVVAAVAKGWDAAAEVETVEDDLRKKAKVVKVRLWKEEEPRRGRRRKKRRRILRTDFARSWKEGSARRRRSRERGKKEG